MWAVVKKSVLGDLMKWFMQFDPKFLCVSCLKRTRDRTCWVPVLATKGWVPTGSLYGERTRQRKANQWHPSCCVRSFLSSYAHRVSIKKVWDTWHEIGSCGSYISSSFCYLSENDHTRSLFSSIGDYISQRAICLWRSYINCFPLKQVPREQRYLLNN